MTAGSNPTKVFLAGHKGMVGSAIARQLSADPDIQIVTRERNQLDLTQQKAVQDFFAEEAIDQVYLAAAKVGGIYANNTYPADFMLQNLAIQNNVIHGAYESDIKRLLFLGSSCIYPKSAPQPMAESALLTGTLEPTNEPYAIAKIAGIKLCESYNRQFSTDYRCVMPTNLYGANDNFHRENSHVIPALMRRFHEARVGAAKKVVVWGSGKACREFLSVDDMAAACIYVMNLDRQALYAEVRPNLSHLNIGTGKDVTIQELAETMARVVDFEGAIEFDTSKPDGALRKLLDVSAMSRLGWRYRIDLEPGLAATYRWFCENISGIRG
jgi:GDP-L-fucose synthase